jgi:hypothetical protein
MFVNIVTSKMRQSICASAFLALTFGMKSAVAQPAVKTGIQGINAIGTGMPLQDFGRNRRFNSSALADLDIQPSSILGLTVSCDNYATEVIVMNRGRFTAPPSTVIVLSNAFVEKRNPTTGIFESSNLSIDARGTLMTATLQPGQSQSLGDTHAIQPRSISPSYSGPGNYIITVTSEIEVDPVSPQRPYGLIPEESQANNKMLISREFECISR